MKLARVRDIFNKPESLSDSHVSVGGWIRTNRQSKNFGFIELNDGSCFKNIQIVYFDNTDIDDLSQLTVGCSVIVDGILKLTPENKQPLEIQAEKIKSIYAEAQMLFILQSDYFFTISLPKGPS